MTRENMRARSRRRIVVTLGFAAMAATCIAAVGLGSGCIFDQGTYQGGGRRGGTPEPAETETSSPTSTGTSTSSPTNDAGGNATPNDADPFDQ
jgi:hypothetical protein